MDQPVYTLLCQKDLPMALVTLPKILQFLSVEQRLTIFDDGSFTDKTVDILVNLSAKIKVVTLKERDTLVNDILRDYPNCRKYRNEFPLAYKLLDIPLLLKYEGVERYTFTDSDIIYIKYAADYFNRDFNTYLRTDAIKLSIKLQDGIIKKKWKIPLRFNSGYFSFGLKDFDIDFVEYYLGLPTVRNIPWLSEQTCWALLFGRAGACYCPKEDEFVCRESFTALREDTLAVHLIGNLKSKYIEWSVPPKEMIKDTQVPGFESSRNVTILDWLQKSVKRFLPAI